MNNKTKYLKIFSNIFVTLLVVLCIVFLVPKLIVFFMPFVLGFLFSLIANPLVKFLEKHVKIKRKYGSVITIVLAISLIVMLFFGIISVLRVGLSSFASNLPEMIKGANDEISAAIDDLQTILNNLPFVNDVDLSEISEDVSEYFSDFLTDADGGSFSAIKNTAMKIPNMVVQFIIFLLATYFFIADKEKLIMFYKKHFPENMQKQATTIYRQTILVVAGYFKAQFKIMFIIYIELVIGLLILQVNYSWLIGLGIAFLDMLPIFGTGTVLIPWAVIKLLTGDFAMAIGMLAIYAIAFVLHQMLQPKLIGDSVGMNPFLALFIMYIGYRVGDLLGMIIAIPIGMILINLGKSGVFDNFIKNIKILINDFNNFRKLSE